MNAMTKLEESHIQTARIRALQTIYKAADEALTNWGLWSMDTRGMKPQPARTVIWDQIPEDLRESWADEEKTDHAVIQTAPRRIERPEGEDYDEKTAVILDERIHGYGGLNVETRLVIRIAYATRNLPEYQFNRFAKCTEDAFCERLENGLRFVARFV